VCTTLAVARRGSSGLRVAASPAPGGTRRRLIEGEQEGLAPTGAEHACGSGGVGTASGMVESG
jgi:hypothetical protein